MIESLRAEVVAADALTAEDCESWRAIAARAPDLASPFFSPDFTQSVAAARDGVRVTRLYRDGEIVGFFPFQFATPWHRMVGAGERVGGHLSDFLGVIGVSGLRLTAEELLRLSGLQAFDVSHLAAPQRAYGLDAEDTATGLAIRLDHGWDHYWNARASADKHFATNTRQKLRKIETALGPLDFRLSRAPDEALGELDRVIDAKRQQYAKTNVADAFAAPWTRRLMHGLAARTDGDCTGLLSTLYAGDTWVGAHFGLRAGATLHHWFPVYNPELARFSPGRLLLMLMLQSAPGAGLTVFDMGAGVQEYKRDFANAEYQVYSGQWRRAGLRAFTYRAAQSLAWRIQAQARRGQVRFSGP